MLEGHDVLVVRLPLEGPRVDLDGVVEGRRNELRDLLPRLREVLRQDRRRGPVPRADVGEPRAVPLPPGVVVDHDVEVGGRVEVEERRLPVHDRQGVVGGEHPRIELLRADAERLHHRQVLDPVDVPRVGDRAGLLRSIEQGLERHRRAERVRVGVRVEEDEELRLVLDQLLQALHAVERVDLPKEARKLASVECIVRPERYLRECLAQIPGVGRGEDEDLGVDPLLLEAGEELLDGLRLVVADDDDVLLADGQVEPAEVQLLQGGAAEADAAEEAVPGRALVARDRHDTGVALHEGVGDLHQPGAGADGDDFHGLSSRPKAGANPRV